jgi:hypothetical protein
MKLERAVSLTSKKNVLISPGTNLKSKSKLSLLSIPDEVLIERASKLGVSLGDCSDKCLKSISVIKNLENDRRIVFLKNNLPDISNSMEHSMVISNASNLCEDLAVDFEEPMVDNQVVSCNGRGTKRGTRCKKEKDIRVSVRRSTRIRKLNNPK